MEPRISFDPSAGMFSAGGSLEDLTLLAQWLSAAYADASALRSLIESAPREHD